MVGVRISRDLLTEVDALAAEFSTTRSSVIRKLVEHGVRQARIHGYFKKPEAKERAS